MWRVKIKTLSIKQPWIDLIFQGRKTIEIRTWKIPKKMELPQDILLHAGKGIDKDSAKMFGINVDKARTGALLGVATLVGMREYKSQAMFDEDKDKHLNPVDWYDGKQIGFIFENIRASQKIFPYKGQLNFFEVE